MRKSPSVAFVAKPFGQFDAIVLSLYPAESDIHFLLLLQDLETWCEDGRMLKNLESDEREDWDEGAGDGKSGVLNS